WDGAGWRGSEILAPAPAAALRGHRPCRLDRQHWWQARPRTLPEARRCAPRSSTGGWARSRASGRRWCRSADLRREKHCPYRPRRFARAENIVYRPDALTCLLNDHLLLILTVPLILSSALDSGAGTRGVPSLAPKAEALAV